MTDVMREGPTLFEPLGDREIPSSVFILTNRYNLLEFLSSGLISLQGIEKYHPDLLRHAVGRLPLFAPPFSRAMIDETSEPNDESSFPVALQIDASQVSGVPVPSLGRDGTIASRPVGHQDALAWAPPGVIPMSTVRQVHFRSQQDLREHQARRYENIFDGSVASVVSRELFEGGSTDSPPIVSWLASLPSIQGVSSAELSALDREAGALSLLAAALPADRQVLSSFASVLEGARLKHGKSEGKAKKGSKRNSKRKADQIAITAGVSPFPSWILDALGFGGPHSLSETERLEVHLFRAGLSVLRDLEVRKGWRATEVLAEVEKQVRSNELPDSALMELAKNFEPIRSILRLEREFRPLNTGKGLAVAKALLMVLLRPDPLKLMTWERVESGADDDVMLTAAFLVGALNGHKRLPIALRSISLDKALAERTVLNMTTLDAIWPAESASGPLATVREHPADDGSSMISVCWRDIPIVTRPKGAQRLVDHLLQLDYENPTISSAAVDVARLLDWADCARATLRLPSLRFDVAPGKDKKSLTISTLGFVPISYALDATRFKERLATDGIPGEREAEISALLPRNSSIQTPG